MENITKTIDDPRFYGPDAINGKAGKFFEYGKYHKMEVEFTVTKNLFSETIFCKIPDWPRPKIIIFDGLTGSFDSKGVRKFGVITLFAPSEFLFSLYLYEIIEILQKLGSTEKLQLWEAFLTTK
jgi:hypothetical protein